MGKIDLQQSKKIIKNTDQFERYDLLGVKLSHITFKELTHFLRNYKFNKSSYTCLPNAYVVTQARKSDDIKTCLDEAAFVLPDGTPLAWLAKLRGIGQVETISGYWMIKNLLASSLKHYFYGVDDLKIGKLKSIITQEFPNANVLGYKSPPFFSENEIIGNPIILNDIKTINKLSPDIIWVGISSPKQDFLMHTYHKHLNRGMMVGVGAVFDYLAGTEKKSPEWIKKIGFRWLYRLIQNPKKHFRKYLVSNFRFVTLAFKDILK